MDLFSFFKDNIHMDKIENFNGDIYELAIVRYVMKEAARIFYRDYTFFLDKENINDRDEIYNKEIDLNNIEDFNIVCKSYCYIIKELLKQNYNINSELISPFEDKFRHVDLLIKTKNSNRYIVDPLTDLIEMQVGLRTNNFASKKHYDTIYKGIIEDVSFLNDKELEEIDNKIDYKNNNVYLDDFFKLLKKKFDNIEEILKKDERISSNLLGKEYKGEQFSDNEKTDLKLRFISRFLNNRKQLNGVVDLLMLSKLEIQMLFTQREQEQINTYSFFIDKQDLKEDRLSKILTNKEDRKRGIVISFNKKNYIFSLDSNSLELDDDEWKKIIHENNIFIKTYYPVQLKEYLKKNGADRNIVHNNEFLRLFNKFETCLLKDGQGIDNIKRDNVFIQDGTIFTKFRDNNISYKIENGNLIIKNYKLNQKYIVLYQDEGRNITYKIEEILQDNEKVNLYEFDSNGLICLDDATGIQDIVEPLSNGKYLSRNSSYYDTRTYSELSHERKRLSQILTDDVSKKNFVILEYLSNASAKVYFEELKRMVENQENDINEAQKCFEEDCENIVRFFRSEPLHRPICDLPKGNRKILERYIEMDNKQILYMFCSNLKFTKPKHIITPGLGSIFVGPMMKSMYGFDYTNILFSLYSKDEKLRSISTTKKFDDIFSNDLWKTTENELVLIDDNVGSCNTMNTIRNQLKDRGKTCKFGAVKYNWEFYNKVKRGELNHPCFDVKDVDFLSILDDPGYWIMRDSIKALKETGGDTYVEVMKQEGFYQKEISDIQILIQLAEKYSKKSDVDLYDLEGIKIKKSSALLCINLRNQVLEIIRKNTKSQELEEK